MDDINNLGNNDNGNTSNTPGGRMSNIFPGTTGNTMNSEDISFTLSEQDFRSISKWGKCTGVFNIIVGVLNILSCLSAPIGIPLLLAGLKLLNAVDELTLYKSTNDPQKLSQTFNSLSKYFKITGIYYIIMVCLWVVFSIIGVLFVIFYSSYFMDQNPNFNYQNDFNINDFQNQ